MTAAHCCDGSSTIRAYTGDHSYFYSDTSEKRFTATSFHMHPNYNPVSLENDVCVLKFNAGLELHESDYADFACLNPGT